MEPTFWGIIFNIVRWGCGITIGLILLGVVEILTYIILYYSVHFFMERTDGK